MGAQNGFAQKICHQQETPASYSNKPADTVSTATTAESAEKEKEKAKKLKMEKAKRVKKPKFSEFNVRVLRDWYETHTANPYPSASEKRLMCRLTGLTKYQVSRWFCNVRTRKPPPELSDDDEDVNSAPSHSSGRSRRHRFVGAHGGPPMMMNMAMPNMPNMANMAKPKTAENVQPQQLKAELQPPPLIEQNKIGNDNAQQ